MERVMYNSVLGAKPIQPDGSAFYYSDYTFNAAKGFHSAKWPCCSGTLPQIAADYRISAYFRGSTGVYVNLYVPSTLSWNDGRGRYSLRQVTDYPYDSHIRLEITASMPTTFSVFLRVPEWAKGASLTLNGKRDSRKLVPGSFAEVRRHWKTNDHIELELPLLSRLEEVDAQHPDTVALVSGPLVLMALRDSAQTKPLELLTREVLLSAKQASPQSRQWSVGSGAEILNLKAFLDIRDETYSAYHKVLPV
jgi:DUF1680 family protein